MAGARVVTLFAALAQPAPGTVIALGLLAAWACFALQFVHYAMPSVGVTAYVVLGFALAGLPAPVAALHRVLATLTGAAIAITGQLAMRFVDGQGEA